MGPSKQHKTIRSLSDAPSRCNGGQNSHTLWGGCQSVCCTTQRVRLSQPPPRCMLLIWVWAWETYVACRPQGASDFFPALEVWVAVQKAPWRTKACISHSLGQKDVELKSDPTGHSQQCTWFVGWLLSTLTQERHKIAKKGATAHEWSFPRVGFILVGALCRLDASAPHTNLT